MNEYETNMVQLIALRKIIKLSKNKKNKIVFDNASIKILKILHLCHFNYRLSRSSKRRRRQPELNIALDSCVDCRLVRALSCRRLPSCCRPVLKCAHEQLRAAVG